MQTAKLFANGRSRAVCLPAAFRFEGETVYICRDKKRRCGFICQACRLAGV